MLVVLSWGRERLPELGFSGFVPSGSHISAGTSRLTAAAQRSLDFGFRAITQHKWVRGGRDPPPSGSGCGQFAWKLKIWGFKEGSLIPGKVFLDDGQVKKNNCFKDENCLLSSWED